MKAICAVTLMLVLLPWPTNGGQIVSGSLEEKTYQWMYAETNLTVRLVLLQKFEKRFPNSKHLPDVYMSIVDLYRIQGDRLKVIEYCEKEIKLDDQNLKATMLLARSYAQERKELDRAVMLVQKAVDRIVQLTAGPLPVGYTDAEWNDYLRDTEAVSRVVLQYVTGVRSRLSGQKEHENGH